MQNKLTGILATLAGIGAFALAGWAGYAVYPSGGLGGDGSVSDPSSTSAGIEVQPVIDDSTGSEKELQSDEPTSRFFRYARWYADETANGRLNACLEFNRPVAQEQEVELRPYIDITPNAPIALSVRGKSLCVGGLSFDTEYNLTLKEGLLSNTADIALGADQDVTVSFGDKPAYVGFTDDGIILPKTETGGLSIETVNVNALDITVERVNHRILSQTEPNAGSQSLEGEYSYGYEAWEEKVEIWSGKLDVANESNIAVKTIFPLQEITQDLDYGAYIVTAKRATEKENDNRVAQAWRWIVSTDMALTSYTGADEMHVNVRSLKTAELVGNVRLDLIARNNDLLGSVQTGADGRSSFPSALLRGQGNIAPKMILAYGPNNDFAMLDLSRSPLDMTAYDVEGRTAQSPVDVFAYTERGVYRPGETVYLTALLRGEKGKARFDRPVKLTLTKPDGGIAFEQTYQSRDMAGALAVNYELPADAPRGVWTMALRPEGMETEKRVRFDVQDFVPQKLKLVSSLADERMLAEAKSTLTLQADFLYGAPGASLEGEAEARVQIENDPFENYTGYNFGDTQETFEERIIEIGTGVTDENGQLTLPVDLSGQDIESSYPLRLMVTSGVAEPGGRFVRKTQYVPLRTQESYIGFKTGFEGDYASRNAPVTIDIVNVSASGEAIDSSLNWTLYEEIHDFQWYRENGEWRYRKDVSDIALFDGEIETKAAPATWSRKLPSGQYRLEAIGPSGHKAALRFNVGWARPGSGVDAPDRIVMGKIEEKVIPGQSVTLSVNSPYAGVGDFVVANETVQSIQTVILPEGESDLTFTFDKSWGDSVYAMLTLYTPEDKDGKSIQRRAAGMSYISLDRTDQTLAVTFDAEEVIEPRQTYEVVVQVANIPKGEQAWVSLAAVDEGILQLTQYESPDAAKYLYGKKAFGLEVRDDYARLLNPNLGTAAILPQGGDSLGGAGLSVVPTQTVALYQGPVQVKNGQTVVSLDIPDFQGQLRLMATAWSKSAVGSGEKDLTVRDPVPLTVGLPRFLAPGDTGFATVSLDNLDGPVGDYSVTPVSTLTSKDATNFSLARDERRDVTIPIAADGLGISDFILNVAGPDGYARTNERQIETRSPYRPQVTKRLTELAPNQTYTLSSLNLDGYILEATDVTLSVSNLPGLDAQTYLNALSVYPYGCTEQTASRAMPLLFVNQLGGIDGLSDEQRHARIDLAIKRLVARQDAEGAFGLWRVNDGNSSPWLQIYVTEFLLLAKENGQSVPQDALDRALSAVRKISDPNRYTNLNLNFNYGWNNSGGLEQDTRRFERAAYAHYVLALADEVDVPDLRYLADNNAKDIRSPLALTYLGAALSKVGDKRRAKTVFGRAMEQRGRSENPDDYYASDLRNAAAMVAVAHDYLGMDETAKLINFVSATTQEAQYLNTQEQSYLVQMIAALDAEQGKLSLKTQNIDLTPAKTSQSVSLGGQSIKEDQTIQNTGNKAVWISAALSGLPDSDPGAMSRGYNVEKQMFSISGQVVSQNQLVKGERAIIRVTIDPEQKRSAMIVLADLLPAGVEIESILLPEDAGDTGPYRFLGELTDLDMAEMRDDRLVASERINRWDNGQITVAYVIRAITQGEFVFPGAVAEDMYRPEFNGRTEAKRLVIQGPGSN
jgi:uncharacterized protein YfaS (alpha-2-macroglobulin family)